MAGEDLTALFVSVVPSFAGVNEKAQAGGKEAAAAFTAGFRSGFDPFKATETGRAAITSFGEAGKKSASAFEEGFESLPAQTRRVADKSADAFEDGFKRLDVDRSTVNALERAGHKGGEAGGRIAGHEFAEGLSTGLRSADLGGRFSSIIGPELSSRMGGFGDEAVAVLGRVGGAGKLAAGATGVGAIAYATFEATQALYDLGAQWDEVTDNITVKTGLMGENVQEISDHIADLSTTLPVSPDQIADVYTSLSRATELYGQNLDDLTTRVSNYNRLYPGDPLNVREFIQTMRRFDVPAQEWGARLNEMNQASIDLGVPLSKIMDTMSKAGPTAMTMGMDFQQTAGLLATFEEGGVKTEAAVKALRTAVVNLAQDGKPLQELMGGAFAPSATMQDRLQAVIDKIGQLYDAGNEVAAIDLGKTVFGKSWDEVSQSIKDGTLDARALNTELTKAPTDINEMAEATDDFSQHWETAKNKISEAFKPLSEDVFAGLNAGLDKFTDGLVSAINYFNELIGLTPPTGMEPPFLPNTPVIPPGLPNAGAPTPGSMPASRIPRPTLTDADRAALKYQGIDPDTALPEDIYKALGKPVPPPAPLPPPPPPAPLPQPRPLHDVVLPPEDTGGGSGGGSSRSSSTPNHYTGKGEPDWQAIAQGESGGNWQTNTGNGFFGGLQIMQSTWDQFGGQQYAPRPDLATEQEQISVATAILQGQGPKAWPNTFKWRNSDSGGGSGSVRSSKGFDDSHLVPGLAAMNDIIGQYFPEVTDIGGYRANDPFPYHPSGRALDIMIPGQGGLNDPTTPAGKVLGDRIWKWMEDTGIFDMNYSLWQVKDHFNHIHAQLKPEYEQYAGFSGLEKPATGTTGVTGPRGTKDDPIYTSSNEAEELGRGLVKGVFQELGFPDVFGKPFTEWGAWKLGMGGLGYATGLLQNAGGGTAAPGSGGGMDWLSALTGFTLPQQHQGTGTPPGPTAIPNAMAPSEAPANVPAAAAAGPVGGPTFIQHNSGITTPDQVGSVAQNFMVDGSRQTATVGAAPGMQPP